MYRRLPAALGCRESGAARPSCTLLGMMGWQPSIRENERSAQANGWADPHARAAPASGSPVNPVAASRATDQAKRSEDACGSDRADASDSHPGWVRKFGGQVRVKDEPAMGDEAASTPAHRQCRGGVAAVLSRDRYPVAPSGARPRALPPPQLRSPPCVPPSEAVEIRRLSSHMRAALNPPPMRPVSEVAVRSSAGRQWGTPCNCSVNRGTPSRPVPPRRL